MTVNWQRFSEVIHAHQRIVLTSHIRPDCDALGSELGMCGVLEAIGKQVRIVNAQPTPPNLAFIDPDRKIKALGVDIQLTDLADTELLMVLDTSAWQQLGEMGQVLRTLTCKKIVLDHHVSEDDLGAEAFKNVQAEATGRLVIEAAHVLGVKLTSAIARQLFAALATDTGWYRFPSVTGQTFRFAAELLEAGAEPPEIYRELYEQDSLARVQLIGRTLARARTEMDGQLGYTAILREDFQATGALPTDTEDIINLVLTVRGTRVAVIFVEQPTGGFKLSFRSRSMVDCSKLAEQFGGGGHKAAAGAFIREPFDVTEKRVLDAVRAAMR